MSRFRKIYALGKITINNDKITINNDKITINNDNSNNLIIDKYDTTIGFIILRHVNSELTNNYWKESYKCIRKFYPNNKIVIIDDNSDYKLINEEEKLINCEIIKSEFPKRGELLPYYYFYKNRFFDKAIIIHDSVFIQKYINFNNDNNNNVKFLWHFRNRNYDDHENTKILISKLNNKDRLLDIYLNNGNWLGCFGVMSVIKHDFLKQIVDKYSLFNLIDYILCRNNRCSLERIFAVVCYSELSKNESYYGSIFNYINWGYTYNQYTNNKIEKDIIKVWTGR